MKAILILLLACLPLLRGIGHAAANNPDTDWFKDARYGVFMHFLPGDAKGLALVKDFGLPQGAKDQPIDLAFAEKRSEVIRWTKAEDYTAGELNEPLQVIPGGRGLAGSQWHALTYLGDNWGRRNTRFSDDQWAEWARKVTAQQDVLTLDMGPNYDPAQEPVGSLAEAQVKQVKAIKTAFSKRANAATR